MITLIRKLLNAFFLLIFLLLSAPTLLFLTKWYYGNLVTQKTYVGILNLPYTIETSDEIISAAKTLFASTDIRAVVINSDGIGGNPGSCYAIYSDLLRLKNIYKKPIISFIEKECFAGSYLIASAADSIISTEGALIGYIDNFFYNQTPSPSRYSDKLTEDYRILFEKLLRETRPKIDKKIFEISKEIVITKKDIAPYHLVDFIGGHLEIERIIKTKTVIDGSIEKIHGSYVEHCVFYVIDLIHRIINHFKK